MGREPDTPLPIAVGVLLFIHTYAALGNGKGTLYEIVAVRRLGATRADVMEIIALAAFHRGPLAINAVAEVAEGYLTDWPVDDGTGVRWPARWAPDVERLRTGIDLSSDRLEEGELDLIRGWYRATTGDVPRHVELLGRIAPDVLKTQRARFETAVRGALPAQLIPLLTVHLSALQGWPVPLRRALLVARGVGVSRAEAVSTLLWAAIYGGDVVMETAVEAAGDVLEGWEP